MAPVFPLGLELFEAAPDRASNQIAKRLVDLPTANHNDVLETEGPAFRRALVEFLRSIERGQSLRESRPQHATSEAFSK